MVAGGALSDSVVSHLALDSCFGVSPEPENGVFRSRMGTDDLALQKARVLARLPFPPPRHAGSRLAANDPIRKEHGPSPIGQVTARFSWLLSRDERMQGGQVSEGRKGCNSALMSSGNFRVRRNKRGVEKIQVSLRALTASEHVLRRDAYEPRGTL